MMTDHQLLLNTDISCLGLLELKCTSLKPNRKCWAQMASQMERSLGTDLPRSPRLATVNPLSVALVMAFCQQTDPQYTKADAACVA